MQHFTGGKIGNTYRYINIERGDICLVPRSPYDLKVNSLSHTGFPPYCEKRMRYVFARSLYVISIRFYRRRNGENDVLSQSVTASTLAASMPDEARVHR